MSSEASVKEAFESFQALHQRLDIMVNCAGIVGPTSINTEDIPLEGWEAVQASRHDRNVCVCSEVEQYISFS